ncbi:MAG TPA: hypothetical protein VMS37_22390, partial [Verrucomicrobiae bacterium]|nr:hypothetical protein [Verrucomicrobiae bacterium]
ADLKKAPFPPEIRGDDEDIRQRTQNIPALPQPAGLSAATEREKATRRLISGEPRICSARCKMLVANQGADTKFHQGTEHTGGRIRAARVVTDIFFERFFATVRAHDARFDGYLRHWPTTPF